MQREKIRGRGELSYNAACLYCSLDKRQEALEALCKAWEAGFRNSSGGISDLSIL
jgi:hypothetical protein